VWTGGEKGRGREREGKVVERAKKGSAVDHTASISKPL